MPLFKRGALSADKQTVEYRKESRLTADQPVMVTALGFMEMPPVSGRVLKMSGSGLQLRTRNPIPCGCPVKVESANMEMLGEVSRCRFDGDAYIVGLMVFQGTSAS